MPTSLQKIITNNSQIVGADAHISPQMYNKKRLFRQTERTVSAVLLFCLYTLQHYINQTTAKAVAIISSFTAESISSAVRSNEVPTVKRAIIAPPSRLLNGSKLYSAKVRLITGNAPPQLLNRTYIIRFTAGPAASTNKLDLHVSSTFLRVSMRIPAPLSTTPEILPPVISRAMICPASCTAQAV